MTETSARQGRLSGRVALITGASWGIGAAVAKAYAHEGASVIVSSYPEKKMEELADGVVSSVLESGGMAMRLSADVTSREQLDHVVAKAREKFGDIDIVVANAAYANRLP